MAYFPQGLGGPTQPRMGIGPAIALGAAAALGVALAVGVISGLSNIQFAYGAVLVGLCAGLVIRRSRTDAAAGLAGAVVGVTFSAVASFMAFTTHALKVGVSLSFVLTHLSYFPHYIGFLGFLFWALGAYVGWATVSSRGGRRRVRGGFGVRRAAAGGPYAQPMYGAPGNPMPGASAQPFFTGGAVQPGYPAPGFGTDQGFGGPADQPPAPPASS
jgi:hypothetical protein